MKEQIQKALKQIESEHDCRILFAVESGSRAWGFASPDSDYDIRAVYVKPLDWYLGLEERQSDTINAMLPGDIDVAAWELRKALRQLLKSNASFMEWLGSPIVYHDCGLIAQLREMESRVVNPISIAHHYASMLRHALQDRTDDGTISVKKLCYALRAGLCVRAGPWSERRCRQRRLPKSAAGLTSAVKPMRRLTDFLQSRKTRERRNVPFPRPRFCRLLRIALLLWRDTRGADRQTTSPSHAPTSSEPFARMSSHDIKVRGAVTMALLPAEVCLTFDVL